MRINNNIMALNAHRQLGINTNGAARAMEKLSSGLRINRAGDDAAGLAISEKMRGQIRGLTMASKNAQDAISLIQTAEGALSETHAILQRMRELAVQSATDTNTEVDRAEIQKEIDQLAQELTRIAKNTEFNTQNLLGGKIEGKRDGNFKATFHIGANESQNIELEINDMSAEALQVTGKSYEAQALGGSIMITALDGQTAVSIAVVAGTTAGQGTSASFADGTIIVTLNVTGTTPDIAATWDDVYNALLTVASQAGIVVTQGEGYDGTAQAQAISGKEFKDWQEAGEATAGINVSTQEAADKAITTINNAIETVSAERSKLGAMQNRLEHTIKNLDTSAENLQAAESRIRDVDMAQEMMEFTKQNILIQAATAMLAQANIAPQSVLQLLA